MNSDQRFTAGIGRYRNRDLPSLKNPIYCRNAQVKHYDRPENVKGRATSGRKKVNCMPVYDNTF